MKKKVLLFTAICALLALSVAMATGAAQAAPGDPKANWSPCHRDLGFPFECSLVNVPLDYSQSGGAAIQIAMVRLPATDPANRIGSLFLNPGGPGGSGVDFALAIAPVLYTPEVRARFDIVGFDPRGIMRSTGLRCFGTPKQWVGYLTEFPYPTSPDEEAIWEAADLYLVSNCEQRAGKIIDHMTTADTARDLDLLRQAVGDDGLTYAGFSYGSFLGNTYANLFPDKVRAVVVDAVLDPIAWTTGEPGQGTTIPFSTRLRSDAGAQATLDEFFRLCDAGGPNCAFSGDSAARYAALVDRLRANPLVLILPDGTTFTFTDANLILETLLAMYNSFSWPSFAEFLALLDLLAPPAAIGASLDAYWQEAGFVNKRGDPAYPNAVEGFPGVACSDSDNPDNYPAWSAAAADAEANFGYFGPIWTWVSSICARWPGSMDSRYAGPFTTNTANPVLVVGNLFDPATRYEGAVTVAGLLPNSRLLTVAGWGHASLFLSQCADTAVANYLVDGTLPAPGTVCNQDIVPFAGPPLTTASSPAAAARAAVVPTMLLDAVRQGVR